MKKMVLVEVTKAYELQAERPTKSDLISESFSYVLSQIFKNMCKITLLYMWFGLGTYFGDLSQSEKLSLIKPPLHRLQLGNKVK